DAEKLTVLKNQKGLQWGVYVDVCNMMGQTAHYAWHEYSQAKPGETIFVTAGTGPGLKVIASVGSEEKVVFIKSLGMDVVFNYKMECMQDVLACTGPIDIYWDNIGGGMLGTVIEAESVGMRFIKCGMISAYNGKEPYHMKNLLLIVGKHWCRLRGHLPTRGGHNHLAHFYEMFPRLVKEGKIKYTEDATRGLERAGHTIVDVQTGWNTGKSVMIVSEK
ncbi:NAD(P)-binding protein, partial [Wolfiporia cocos MD-104 SS10]